jgi:hypothetical protein
LPELRASSLSRDNANWTDAYTSRPVERQRTVFERRAASSPGLSWSELPHALSSLKRAAYNGDEAKVRRLELQIDQLMR